MPAATTPLTLSSTSRRLLRANRPPPDIGSSFSRILPSSKVNPPVRPMWELGLILLRINSGNWRWNNPRDNSPGPSALPLAAAMGEWRGRRHHNACIRSTQRGEDGVGLATRFRHYGDDPVRVRCLQDSRKQLCGGGTAHRPGRIHQKREPARLDHESAQGEHQRQAVTNRIEGTQRLQALDTPSTLRPTAEGKRPGNTEPRRARVRSDAPATHVCTLQTPRQRGHQGGLAGPRRTPDQPSPALSANALCQSRGISHDTLHSTGIVVRCHHCCGRLWEYRDGANLLARELCFTLSK